MIRAIENCATTAIKAKVKNHLPAGRQECQKDMANVKTVILSLPDGRQALLMRKHQEVEESLYEKIYPEPD